MYMRLNLKTIKFSLIKLATDFYWQPSYILVERASFAKHPLHQNKSISSRPKQGSCAYGVGRQGRQATLMDQLHWQNLLAKLSVTVTCNSHVTVVTVLALATLGSTMLYRNYPICVAQPKVAKASTVMYSCCWHFCAKLRQWKHSLNVNIIVLATNIANITTIQAVRTISQPV
jgi:hypothetical protein